MQQWGAGYGYGWQPPPPPPRKTNGCLIAFAIVAGGIVVFGIAGGIAATMLVSRSIKEVEDAASASAVATQITSANATTKWPDAKSSIDAKVAQSEAEIKTGDFGTADDDLGSALDELAKFDDTPAASQKDFSDSRVKIQARRRSIAAQVAPILAQRKVRGRAPSSDDADLNVRAILRMTANDPSSITDVDCGPIQGIGEYWIVECSYRGKNGFGATVLSSSKFYFQDGLLVKTSD